MKSGEYILVVVDNSRNSLDSSRFVDLVGGINSINVNKILLSNISNFYLLEGKIVLGFPLLKKYENIFKSNLIDYDISENQFYRPEYVSEELYETTDLWYLLMFVNDMDTVEKFNKKTIKVFPDTILNTINKIINQEKNMKSTVQSPRYVKKHMLHPLNEKSKDLLGTDINETIPWHTVPDFSDNKDEILNANYNLASIDVEMGKVTDNDGRYVDPFTLDDKGLTSIPSYYFKKGYTKSFTGKIYLDKSKKYGLTNNFSGNVRLMINNLDTAKNIVNINKDFNPNEMELLSDFRDDNLDKFVNSYNGTFVSYDEDQGRYVHVLDSTIKKGKNNIISVNFTADSVNNYRDINRIKDNRLFFTNLEYSSSFNNDDIDSMGYEMIITYTDSTTESVTTLHPRSDIFNTNKKNSYLKLGIIKSKSISIEKITVNVIINAKKDTTAYIKTKSINIKSYSNNDSYTSFTVPSSGWYNINLLYNYKTIDDKGVKIFPKDSFEGIYFHPTIQEINGSEIITNNPSYNNGRIIETIQNNVKIKSNPVIIKSSRDNETKNNIWKNMYSTNLTLPDEYIITFKLKHTSPSKGGAILFALDYNKNDNSGYGFFIKSDSTNSNLPPYNSFSVAVGNIASNGFKEIDQFYGTKRNIFKDDPTLYIKTIDTYDYNFDSKLIKVIKKNNRIRVFIADNNNNYDYLNPLINFKDMENVNINGGISMQAIFGDLSLELIEFYKYNRKDKGDI
ncbi:hypothetical protein FPHOBKDP_00155 [Listeria phage LPJP1]|nr:hypothetical protein FPHOBKDP_00155 [Listeria phage LPJP1]